MCPMQGNLAPELASGKLHEVLKEAWSIAECDLHSLPILQGTAPLTDAEHANLTADFFAAQSRLMTILQVKLQHWSQLPWVLCGLAVSDEAKARETAELAIAEWEKETHHECMSNEQGKGQGFG